MIISLQIAPPMRAWHRRLVDRLEVGGHRVAIELVPAGRRDMRVLSTALLLSTERRLYRARGALFAPVETLRSVANVPPQLRIVLAGSRPRGAWLQPLFDGTAGEGALVQALLDGRAPVITIRSAAAAAASAVLAAGLPANEHPLALSRALDGVLSRLVTLLVQAVDSLARPVECVPVPDRQSGPERSVPGFLWQALAGRVARRFGPARGRPHPWCIGWRAGGDRDGPWSGLTVLPDDGARFYADPFPIEEAGSRYLFFEDYPYATRKGVIGYVSLDAAGTPSVPRVVLEAPVHLSYPFLLRDGSQIYMLPEMSAGGRIQLFRADPFPDRWVPDHILVEGVMASDATLIRHGDLYWLFATLSEPGESTWDQLGLFHAPSLFGPWTAHPRNPVLIDAGAARPAGAMWHEAGHLMRVAQDCRGGYGLGLAICRVDRLDETGFAQTVVRRVEAPDGLDALGVHTLNVCADLTVIDLNLRHRWRRSEADLREPSHASPG